MPTPTPSSLRAQCRPLTVASRSTTSAEGDVPTTSLPSDRETRRAPSSSCTSTNQAPPLGAEATSSVTEDGQGSSIADIGGLLSARAPYSAATPAWLPELSPDRDAERLSQREVLVADREDEELLHLLRGS